MQQMGGMPQGPAFKVVTVDASCCTGVVPIEQIEGTANQMIASGGYKLHQVYIDVRTMCGPCVPMKTAVLIFKRTDIP